MSKGAKDLRRLRRELLQRYERTFDAALFDYNKQIRPAQGKSKLVGIAVAFGIYSTIFGIAYFSWASGRVSYELFMKTTWVLLVPASAAGLFSWMLAFNRMDNAARIPIRRRIEQIEGDTGMLWRYAPILSAAEPKNTGAKTACNRSRDLQIPQLDEEDYCSAVKAIHNALRDGEETRVPFEVLQEAEANFAS